MFRRRSRNLSWAFQLIVLPILLLMVALVATPALCLADVSVRERAIDVVLLDDGTRLLGVVMPPSANTASDDQHVTMLLRAAWLKENQPEFYDECLVAEDGLEPAVTVQSLLEDHIVKLQNMAIPNVQRITFLTEELNAIQPLEVDEGEPDVFLLKIPVDRIRRQMLKKSSLRRLAGLGILNDVDTTETAKATELKKTLQEIDPSMLVENLPGGGGDDAEEGFHQILLHADRTIGKKSRLVFFNGTWLSESSAAENQQAMVMQMMAGGLQSQLQQLLNETAGPVPGRQRQPEGFPNVLPMKAVALAKSEDADVVEVRTMKLNPGSGTATVGIAVYWQSDDSGVWKKVRQVSASANQSDVTAESKQRILQDERVKEVTAMFSQLGVNSGQLNSALTMGSVVESASGRAEQLLSQSLQPPGATAVAGLSVMKKTLAAESN